MSAVMTVRVDEELLARIKAAAESEDRSVSSYVLRVLRQHLEERAAPGPTKAKSVVMGSLRHLGAPETLEAFREARRDLSAGVERGVTRRLRGLERK